MLEDTDRPEKKHHHILLLDLAHSAFFNILFHNEKNLTDTEENRNCREERLRRAIRLTFSLALADAGR